MRVVLHRPLEGTPKTCTIRRSSTGKWYAIFSCEVPDTPLPPSPEQVGIDVGLATFATLSCLSEKAASAARTFVAVNPAYTSQDCSACGARKAMPLTERVYSCVSCGLVLDRDHNASLNILAVGLHSLGLASRSPRL